MKRRQILANFTKGAILSLIGTNILYTNVLAKNKTSTSTNYQNFLQGIYRQALDQGMNATILKRALNFSIPNAKIIQLDHKQPEFTLTWEQYYQKVITSTKINNGRFQYQQRQKLLSLIWQRFQVDPTIILAIWGIESAYGQHTGKFNVIDSLATLTYEGRRAKFFKAELMNALKILDNQDITPENMSGSYAGAMGQPQFMPSAYLHYAVDFSGKGQRNIWTNTEDVLASIANYLKKSGWHTSEPWGQKVILPETFSSSWIGHRISKSLGEWHSLGVRREDGSSFSRTDITGSILRPDGQNGQAFIVYHNFNVIRRYNPSDYYALAVGLLGDAILT